MAQTAQNNVQGKRILVTSGAAKELIDGVRYFTNAARPEDHGHRVARALAQAGALVTLVNCSHDLDVPQGVDICRANTGESLSASSEDLLAACKQEALKRNYDAFFHLACVSSLRPVARAEHKLKVKTDEGSNVLMDVVANVDVFKAFAALGRGVVVGYDLRQKLCQDETNDDFCKAIVLDHLHRDRVVFGASRQPYLAKNTDLKAKKIIVSSGPTAEPVTRYADTITNLSTGTQGHEIACALADRGADVVLVSGPVLLPDPVHPNIRTVHVSTTCEMLKACVDALPAYAYIGVAAVADFRADPLIEPDFAPRSRAMLCLVQNPDILKTMGMHATMRPDHVIGFAAETRDLETYARKKLETKGADVIFANLVGGRTTGFGGGRNHVVRISKDGRFDYGETEKYQVGQAIADLIASDNA